jgi:hypothetical protein
MKSFADWTQEIAEAQNHEPEPDKATMSGCICDDCFSDGASVIFVSAIETAHLCEACYDKRANAPILGGGARRSRA